MSLGFPMYLLGIDIANLWHQAVPGLWVALLYGLALYACHRLREPLDPRAAAGFLLAVGILFGTVLFGGQVLLPLDNLRGTAPFHQLEPTEPHGNILQGDLIQLVEPSRRAVAESLRHGRWPLVMDAGGGVALLADPQAQAFQPLTLAVAPLTAAQAPGALAALKVLLALLGTYLLLRRLGASEASATAGAFAYGLSGFVVLWVGWPLSTTAAWLPVLLWALDRWVAEDGSRRGRHLLVAVTWGSLLLAGHPETVIYGAGTAVAWGAWRLYHHRSNNPHAVAVTQGVGNGLRKRGATLALILAITTGAVAPVWLPALLHAPTTRRWIESADAEPPALQQRLLRLVPGVAVNALGNDRYTAYWGPGNHNEDAGAFVGTATLLAAALGLLCVIPQAWMRYRRREADPGAMVGAGFFAILLTVSLGLQLRPPGLAWLLDHLPLLGAFRASAHHRLVMLMALSLAVLAAHGLDHAPSGRRRWKTALAATGIGAGLVAAFVFLRHPTQPETLEVLRFGWLHWQGRFLLIAAAVLLLMPRRRFAPWGVAGLVGMELILAFAASNPAMPPRLFFPTPPAIDFLQQRIAQGQRIAAEGEALPPNLSSLYRLPDARVYNPVEGAAWSRALAPLRTDVDSNVPLYGFGEDPRWDDLGVAWWLTAPDVELDLPLAYDGSDARIYRRPSSRPWLRLETPNGSPREIIYLRPHPERIEIEVPSGLRTTDGAPHQLIAAVDTSNKAWRLLAFTPTGYRPLATASDAPLGLTAPLPSEARQLVLLHRPPGLLAGVVIATLAFALAFALLAPRPERRASCSRKDNTIGS